MRLPAAGFAAVLAFALASPSRAEGDLPTTLEGWLKRQEAMLIGRDEARAVDEARARVAKEPDSPEALYLLGRILYMTGKKEEGRAQYQQALDLDPNYGPGWMGMSSYHFGNKEFDTALREAEKAHLVDPSPETRELKARIYYAKGDRPGAYRVLTEALKEAPGDWRTRMTYARFLLGDGLVGEAERELRVVLATEPRVYEAREALVKILWDRGDRTNRDRAIEEVRTGMRAEPRSIRMRFLLRDLHVERKEFSLAADVMEGVLGLDLPAEERSKIQQEIRRLRMAAAMPGRTRAPTAEELKKKIDSEDVEERREALRILAASEGEVPDEAFRHIVDPDETARRYATRLWLQRANERMFVVLDGILFGTEKRETVAGIRAEIVAALGNVRSPAALPTLVLAVSDEDPETVRAAIEGIAQITGKSFVDDSHRVPAADELPGIRERYVRWWLEEPSGRFFRRKAAAAIAEFGQRSLAPYVLLWITDEDASLRAAVLDCLAQLCGHPEWKEEDTSTPEARVALKERLVEAIGEALVADLLVEIGTEELPARRVAPAAEALRDGLAKVLVEAGLLEAWKPEGQPILGTPRRLAAFVPGVKERQPDREERAWGPPVAAATGPDGNPTKAGEGFAKTVGVPFADLKRGEKVPGKPPYVYADRVLKGRAAAEVIAELLPKVAASLPFKRTMRWPQSDMVFARPIRNLVVLLGNVVVPCRLAGVEAGKITRGHAFLKPKPFEVPRADLAEYVALLRKAKVVVDFAERSAEIEKQVRRARAGALGSGRKGPWSRADDELLPEVAGLVEWPRALVGSFDAQYRDLPPALLVTAMAHHLRYFPIAGEDGRPQGFVSVTDREERHADSIREGNERVLRARLYDAAFFFANDRKRKLEEFRPALAGVDFHKGLGTLLDKSERVRRIAVSLGDTLKLSPEVRAHADRAAFLLKCDLLTEVVKEFPELQGNIGAHYTRLAGEPPAVADAVESQYLPAGVELARVARERGAAALVCLAERADSMVSYFSIGEEPTGSADPFGLRRAALALLDLLEHSGWPLSVQEVIRIAGDARVQRPTDESMARLKTFLWTRVEFLALSRPEGYVDFVGAAGESADRPLGEYWERLGALASLKSHACWPDLIALVERTGNMGVRGESPAAIPPAPPEVASVDRALRTLRSEVEKAPMARAKDRIAFAEMYVKALGTPVAAMFDKVLVDDPKEPARRAAIKGMLYEIFTLFRDRLGDLRKLGGGARTPRA